MPLLPDQLDDFTTLTLDNFKKKSWVDLSLSNQDHVFANRFLSGKKRTPYQGGGNLNWKVQTTNTGTAKFSELYSVDATAVKDLMTTAKAPFCKPQLISVMMLTKTASNLVVKRLSERSTSVVTRRSTIILS